MLNIKVNSDAKLSPNNTPIASLNQFWMLTNSRPLIKFIKYHGPYISGCTTENAKTVLSKMFLLHIVDYKWDRFLFIFISFLAATALYTLYSRKKSNPYIFQHTFSKDIPFFSDFGRNTFQLSFNTRGFKWLTTPELCEYTTLWNITQNYC